MDTPLFAQYNEIEQKIKALELEKDALKPKIEAFMNENSMGQAKTEFGTFFFSFRRKWSYTPEVKTLEKVLKEKKALEEQTGVATYTESKSLGFRTKKENEDDHEE